MNKFPINCPKDGEIKFVIERPPVSLQSKPDKKNEFKSFIRNFISCASFYLSGDVKISISWYVHEQKRYESSATYDIDNIIKPFIDGISGINGIIIDDNQVQEICCNWQDSYNEEEKLVVLLRFDPFENKPKDSIYFIEFKNSLCLPLWSSEPSKLQLFRLEQYEKMLKYRDEWEAKVKNYYTSKNIIPTQRVFHKSRLSDFIIKKADELKLELCNT